MIPSFVGVDFNCISTAGERLYPKLSSHLSLESLGYEAEDLSNNYVSFSYILEGSLCVCVPIPRIFCD
jgi:hypothetical protein